MPAAEHIPFTGVEELLFLLDSPAEPQNQRLELEIPAVLDVVRLRAAVNEVVQRHPLLRVRLRPWRPSDRRLVWEVDDEVETDPVVVVAVRNDEELRDVRDELVSRPFSLLRSPPLRVALIESGLRSHLLLVVHHTAVDGQALLTIMRELVAAYAGRSVPPDGRRFLSDSDEDVAGWRQRAVAVGRVAAGALHRPTRVASETDDGSSPGCHLGGVRLDRDRTNALDPKRLCPDAGFTDLLLAAGITAIARWNSAHGMQGGRISLLHAVGLPPVEGRPPLSNAWMATVIGATVRQRRDPRQLITEVAAQRRRHLADTAASGLRAALGDGLPVPIWAKRVIACLHPMTGHRLVETAALTNLGRLETFDFGDDLRSDALWIDSAVRLPKGLFMGAALYDGSLHISLRSMRAQLNRGALDRFGALYLHVLEELA